MMNAKEARRLTEEAIKKEIAERRYRAEEFCNELQKEIEEACNNKKSSISVLNIPDGLYSYVIDICKDKGYEVTQLNKKLLQLNW